MQSTTCIGPIAALALAASPALAQPFEIDWYTIDGGGVSNLSGGTFTLDATIGQPDAGVLTGGSTELLGGFWAVPFPPQPCNIADLAMPFGQLTFGDVGAFITAFNAMDPAADLAVPFGTFTFGDIGAFLNAFAAGCP
jgi:hypothetical protein